MVEAFEEKLIREIEEIRSKYPFEFVKIFITTKANSANITIFFTISSKTFRADFTIKSEKPIFKSDLKNAAEKLKSFYMQTFLSNFAFELNTTAENVEKEEIVKDNRVFLVLSARKKNFYNVFNYLVSDNYLEVAIRLYNFV